MLRHLDWTIVNDVTNLRSALFFTIKESKKDNSWTLKVKVKLYFESSTKIYQTTRRNIRDSLFIKITSLRAKNTKRERWPMIQWILHFRPLKLILLIQ